MGLLGKPKTDSSIQKESMKYELSEDTEELKKKIESTCKSFAHSFAKTGDKMSVSALAVIVQQNELIIKYLDDISKKLDNIK